MNAGQQPQQQQQQFGGGQFGGPSASSGAQLHPSMGGGAFRPGQNAYGYPTPPNVYGNPVQQGSVPGPAFGGMPWGVNDATAQIGMQLGRNAVQAGQEYVEKTFGGYLFGKGSVKQLFNVSNGYVVRKLGLILFPWRNKGWNRRVIGGTETDANGTVAPKYAPPREDLNAPDLYIPSMALVTYIVISALRAGLDSNFHPEVLAAKTSTAITIIILECLFVKLGCYALGVEGSTQLLDIASYVGYKFVASTALLLFRILHLRASLYWTIFIYLFAANGFFLLRSLRAMVLAPASSTASRQNASLRSYRVMFLFSVAALQVPGMWFLS